MNPFYIGLGVAIAVMVVAIVWLLATKRVTVTATATPQASPMLAKSFDQTCCDHMSPVFEDMLDKERARAVVETLYAAYKGIKIEPKS